MQKTYFAAGTYGLLVGLGYWAGASVFSKNKPNLFKTLETTMYYDQPLEQWGYSHNPEAYNPPEPRVGLKLWELF